MSAADLGVERRVHVVAAGGAGMSAIATVLVEQGHHVSGSDLVSGAALQALSLLGVRTHVGHDADNLGDAEIVVASTAVDRSNPELIEARRRGLPVLSRLELLPSFAARQPFVSVAGTHGKTTTSSMLTVALTGIGAEPSFLIGARVPSLGAAAGHRRGELFVLEADESDASFLAGPRAAALVTNVEADHLEFWGGWEELCAGFERFIDETDGPAVVCADDAGSRRLVGPRGVATYGVAEDATYRVRRLELSARAASFELVGPHHGPLVVELAVPGAHNALNAAGALAVVAELAAAGHDLDVAGAAAAIATYDGVARRFEDRGVIDGAQLIDDYAHLPTEIRAALAAGRSGGWDRLVVVFQPHRYSRTEALRDEFAAVFGDADLLVLTDIYPAGEAPRPGVDGRSLYDAVRSTEPSLEVAYEPSLDDVAKFLDDALRPGDLCLTVGAGDVTTVADRVRDLRRDAAGPT